MDLLNVITVAALVCVAVAALIKGLNDGTKK